jgi:hypothetical protein
MRSWFISAGSAWTMAWADGKRLKSFIMDFVKIPVSFSSYGNVIVKTRFISHFRAVIWLSRLSR